MSDIIEPLGSVTHTDYDPYGNASDVTYGYGSTMDRTWHRDYDLSGQVTEVDDSNGNELGYRYDSVGRLIAIVDATTKDPYTTYSFDDAGRAKSVVNATGTVDYAYNDLGQVESITADGQEVDYTYTDLGQRDTMTLPGSRVVDYGYSTTTDELESIDDFSTQPGPTRYSWTLDGQLDEIDRPPDALDSDLDIVTNYGYDAAGRLTGISHSQDSVELAESRRTQTQVAVVNFVS